MVVWHDPSCRQGRRNGSIRLSKSGAFIWRARLASRVIRSHRVGPIGEGHGDVPLPTLALAHGGVDEES